MIKSPGNSGTRSTTRSQSSGGARKSTPKQSAQRNQRSQRANRGDRASVGREARAPQASNPVNFSAWSGGLLKNGSRGGDVATMQKTLNEKGANIKVDGKFGKETRAAVEKFQKEHNLRSDGLAGDKTREALMSSQAPRQPQQQSPTANGSQQQGPGAVQGPGQNRPAQNQPAQSGPAQNRPAQNQPAQNGPAQNRPAQNEPAATNRTEATREDLKRRTPFGDRLAADARRIAESGVAGSGRNCKRGVRMALEKQGQTLGGVSAYMAANQLARNDKFKEIKGLERGDLRNLPPGATVVWNKGPGHPHGHISIAMGNGREASDVMRNQIVNYPSSYRVFLPQ